MNRTRVASLAVVFALHGCATVRFYPVCVLDTGYATAAQLWSNAKPVLGDVILRTVPSKMPARLDFEGALVTGYAGEHTALARVWPQYACVIASNGQIGADILLNSCRQRVTRYLKSEMPYWSADLACAIGPATPAYPPSN